MRNPLTTLLTSSLLFSGITVAADQAPLKDKVGGWFEKAKSYVTDSIPNPVDAGAAAVADGKVEKINERNYLRKLQPKLEGEEEWLVYLTGGNKSCLGRCERSDRAWNESVALLSALPQPAGSPPLHLAQLDCEKEIVLCSGWGAACPSVYHFTFPQKPAEPNAPTPESPLRVVDLNWTTIAATDFVKLARSAPGSTIMDYPTYTGAMHPVDGWLAKFGLQYPMGYVIWGMGTTPSWLIMIFISFMSRQFMSRRMGTRPGIDGSAAPPAGQQPAAAARGVAGNAAKAAKKKK